MKKLGITLAIIGALAIAFCAGAITLRSLVYPATMLVDEINGDTVVLRTSTGHLYAMTGSEDWEIGDMASLLMFSKGTDVITDDIILTARYSGF